MKKYELRHNDDSQMRSPIAKVITFIRSSEIDLWKGYLLIAVGYLKSLKIGKSSVVQIRFPTDMK